MNTFPYKLPIRCQGPSVINCNKFFLYNYVYIYIIKLRFKPAFSYTPGANVCNKPLYAINPVCNKPQVSGELRFKLLEEQASPFRRFRQFFYLAAAGYCLVFVCVEGVCFGFGV